MELRRLLRHLCASHRMQRRAFPPRVTDAITEAVRCVEQHDEAEIRFVVEAALEPLSLLRRQTSRERALELFSLLGVWDTAHNDGVLIYVLLADRAVEIVVDRGIAARVPSETWAVICRRMEASFARRDYQHGALARWPRSGPSRRPSAGRLRRTARRGARNCPISHCCCSSRARWLPAPSRGPPSSR